MTKRFCLVRFEMQCKYKELYFIHTIVADFSDPSDYENKVQKVFEEEMEYQVVVFACIH